MAETAEVPPRTPLETTLAAIRSGPQGAEIAAFFDLGGTVVGGFRTPRARRTHEIHDVLLDGLRDNRTSGDYRRNLEQLERALAGRTETELDEIGTRTFEKLVYGHLYREAWQLILAHQDAGHTVVLVSSLTRFHLRPLARELGVDHLLYTRMATHDGTLTGRVEGSTLWHDGKAEAVTDFAAEHRIDLRRSWAYADSTVDLPLLGLVGNQVAVNPDPHLNSVAAERDWPTLAFRPRHDPRPRDFARTVLAFTGLIGGCLGGIASKSATRDRQRMADALMSSGSRTSLRMLGVKVRVTGAENTRAPRPAVFLFNHQSQLDILIVPHVVDGPVAPIAKKELTKNPVFGPILRFTGATFLDRANSSESRKALQPVVETLRAGTSVAVAPEGTRSRTPTPGPFKKGAFHMAIQAGVPVIPVVIRNAGELCWRDEMVVRRGTVDVAVLEPIDVRGWDPENLDAEIASVRRRYLDTLLNWPK
ncbi:HAD-IB family hydrolase [Nocardia callitridis]|uniref:1-acyl-sn-glycerol-3-phosphate acyltransferase n=1 Tax=Nocardia callitridis TaxID=648753 RepID=A0ABP9KXP3_9NOCA